MPSRLAESRTHIEAKHHLHLIKDVLGINEFGLELPLHLLFKRTNVCLLRLCCLARLDLDTQGLLVFLPTTVHRR